MSLVLVVDDEPDVRLMLTMALRFAGYDVEQAATGRAAIESIEAADFDAIVLDIHLPDMVGWDVLSVIHRSPSKHATPVVVVTADVTQGDPGIRDHDGMYWDLMYKPMDPEDLVEALARAGAEP